MKRPQAFLLAGPTGSGKTPLGELLEARGLGGRGCVHLDFGRELRSASESARLRRKYGLNGKDLSVIRDSLARGTLLENETFPVAEKILRGFMKSRGLRSGDLLILNGIPRHVGQVRDIGGILDIVLVVCLECGPRVVAERIRRNAGGDRAGREDDTPPAVALRLKRFRARTLPVLDCFKRSGVRLLKVRVGVKTGPEEIVGKIIRAKA